MTEQNKILGNFIMTIGGKSGSSMQQLADVELTSLDPLFPVPDCLTELNPLPFTVSGHGGAVDYSRKYRNYQTEGKG